MDHNNHSQPQWPQDIDPWADRHHILMAQPTPFARALAAMAQPAIGQLPQQQYTSAPYESINEQQQVSRSAVTEISILREQEYQRQLAHQTQELEALRLKLTQQQENHRYELATVQQQMYRTIEELNGWSSVHSNSPLILLSNSPAVQQSQITTLEDRVMSQLDARSTQLHDQLLEQNRQTTQALESAIQRLTQATSQPVNRGQHEQQPPIPWQTRPIPVSDTNDRLTSIPTPLLGSADVPIVHGRTGRRLQFREYSGEGDALAWLLTFDKVATYFQWNENAKIQEFGLSMVEDTAYWWEALDASRKTSFEIIKCEFVSYHGGGIAAGEATMDKLHSLHQGTMSMTKFEVAKEVAKHHPVTLDEAINYAISLERVNRQANKKVGGSKKINNFGTINLAPTIPSSIQPALATAPALPTATTDEDADMQLNSQFKRNGKCHNCGKMGHWKKECRAPKRHQKGKKPHFYKQKYPRQNAQSQEPPIPDSETSTGNYFDQIWQTTMFTQGSQESGKCFFVPAVINNQNVDILVDTGSDITSATASMIKNLGIEFTDAPLLPIGYGDGKTTQVS
ncbi:hypothetical protein INT45_011171 [Circinella minor]|uniref:CCHC-type domain-containing protein n=1 Tax=Circinella minor TaxID=1195481 RepID=A0A8H7VB99_9FUNG|nr:hypothetical protein INT45_011171 [Circinella minor]